MLNEESTQVKIATDKYQQSLLVGAKTDLVSVPLLAQRSLQTEFIQECVLKSKKDRQ